MGKEGVVIVIQAQNGIQKILIADEAVVFRIILRLQHVVFVLGFLHMIGKYLLGESILILIVRVKGDPADISAAADLRNGDFLKWHFLQNGCQRRFDIAFRFGDTFIFKSVRSAFPKNCSPGLSKYLV